MTHSTAIPSTDIHQIIATAPFVPDVWRVTPPMGDVPKLVQVVKGWPEPLSLVHGISEGRWLSRPLHVPAEAVEPGFEATPGVDLDGWSSPIVEIIRGIPREVRAAVAPLVLSCQWWTVQLLALVPEALELVRDIPTLGGLLSLPKPYCDPFRKMVAHPVVEHRLNWMGASTGPPFCASPVSLARYTCRPSSIAA